MEPPPPAAATNPTTTIPQISLDDLKKKPMQEWEENELGDWLAQVNNRAFKKLVAMFSDLNGAAFGVLTEKQIKNHVPGLLGDALFNVKQEWLVARPERARMLITEDASGSVQHVGPVKVRVIVAEKEVEIAFAQLPTVGELFTAFTARSLPLAEMPKLKIYFRQRDGRYVGVTANDRSLSWDMYDCDGSTYFARVSNKTPPPSPERPAPRPLLQRADISDLAAKLERLTVDADREPAATIDIASVVACFRPCPPQPPSDFLTAETLGLMFPLVGLEEQAVQLATDVVINWQQWLSPLASVRGVTSFAAQGASGTGKTRLGRELARLILSKLRTLHAPHKAPSELIAAMEQCVQRNLTLCFDFKQHAGDHKPNDIRSADLLWQAYTMTRLPALPHALRCWQPSSPDHVFEVISAVERRIVAYNGPIAIVVHLDECQALSAMRLGELIYRALTPFCSSGRPSHGIFPIAYVSGINKLQVVPPGSATIPKSLSLPFYTREHYAYICQHVFGIAPSREMVEHAFATIEGAPRLLLLLLWAMQAPEGAPLAALLPAQLDLAKIRTALSTTDRDKLTAICKRATLYLPAASVVTFTENVHKHRLHLIFALALLGRIVPLAAKLEEDLTVAEVIAHGLALSRPDPTPGGAYPHISEAVVLYVPLIYWRYLQKNTESPVAKIVPQTANTPTKPNPQRTGPIMNEESDIRVFCLRLFCSIELAWVAGHNSFPLSDVLPFLDDSSVRVKVPPKGQTHAFPVDLTTQEALVSDAHILPKLEQLLPSAWLNGPLASFADSILMLELTADTPQDYCKGAVPASNKHLLAVFVQSKFRAPHRQHVGEAFVAEYRKCSKITCVPWIFVLISDSDHTSHNVAHEAPYNGNGYFMNGPSLQRLYGERLAELRKIAWSLWLVKP